MAPAGVPRKRCCRQPRGRLGARGCVLPQPSLSFVVCRRESNSSRACPENRAENPKWMRKSEEQLDAKINEVSRPSSQSLFSSLVCANAGVGGCRHWRRIRSLLRARLSTTSSWLRTVRAARHLPAQRSDLSFRSGSLHACAQPHVLCPSDVRSIFA